MPVDYLTTMVSRHPDKDMVRSWGSFDTTIKLCKQAHTKQNVKRYLALLQTLETTFYKFDEDWRIFKEDSIKKIFKTEEAFNGTTDTEGVTAPNVEHNDSWNDLQLERFIDTRELLQDVLDQHAVGGGATALDQRTLDAEFAVDDIKADLKSLQDSISKLKLEIEGHDDQQMPVSTAMGYEHIIDKLQAKIETDLRAKVLAKLAVSEEPSDPEFSNAKLREKYGDFAESNKSSLHTCTMLLVKKALPRQVEEKPSLTPTSQDNGSSSASGYKPREQVFLEKSKPPKFSGDDLDFPEFKRKWLSQVNKANLPEETELDKLRDAVPKDAKDQLYGVVKLDDAWATLTQRYGDKLLISKKLKSQLKSIQCVGKSDPERVINLKIKVRNLVTRLETMDMGGALTHDSEYLAAVYCALPDRHRVRWLDYEKEEDHWASMLKFLDKAYDQANQELALLSVYNDDKKKDVRSAGLTVEPVGGGGDDGRAGYKEAKKKARESCGKCPACDLQHTWQRKDGSWWPSDRFLSCKKFKDMNIQQRAAVVERAKGCPRCTAWNHQRKDCRMRANSCGADLGGGACTGDHSKLLHDSGNVYCAALNAATSHLLGPATDLFSCVKESEETIFFLQDIPIRKSRVLARVMWDKGSNRVLVSEAYAKKCNLVSKEVTYLIEVVGKEPEQMHSKIYLLDMIDMYGNVHTIWGYGVPKIMTSSVPDLSHVRHLFPHIPDQAFSPLATKEVDVLIGLNMNELQPAGGLGNDRVGGLTALRSLFGTGWVVGGHHDDIKVSSQSSVTSAAATLQIAKILIEPQPSFTPEFWESEGMGVLPPPRCDNCRGCMERGSCSEKHYSHSVKKQAELDLIKEKTKLHNGEVWCDYPFMKDPACLPFNRNTVVKVAEKVERDLIRDNLHEAYNDQIRDQLKRGVAVQLSEDELASWTGPCQYITHHAVLKDSITTPVRVVSNSSFNNGGRSLNSCLASGPNSLNPMLDVMLRYRCNQVAVQSDLAKAYNTLRTGPVERNCRRFVWRFSPSDPWQDFALDRVHFGDACAATQLEVAKDIVADAGAHIDPEAATRIQHDVYVDDVLTGGTAEQVDRFVGKKMADGSYDGTFSRILGLGNFRIKAFGISGQKTSEESDLLGSKVLGYHSNLEKDMLAVSFPINLSKKKRSVRQEPNLTLQDVDSLRSRTLTKRLLLGVVNGFGDFLGIASPFTIRYKVMMRQLFLLEESLTWDQPVPEQCRQVWVDLMVETLKSGTLEFPRCTRPDSAKPGRGPELVGFSDHGGAGYEARVYLRWELESETAGASFSARLAICKARVPPLQGLTVPRGELTALTLLSRLLWSVVVALQRLDFPPVSAVMLADSKCAISSVYSTRSLLPYFQNRVAEVKENMVQVRKLCPLEDIHYVETALNPSDLSTRATASVSELGPDSFHQTGPYFLSIPRSDWPVSAEYSPEDIPDVEFRVRDKLVFTAAARSNFCHPGLYPENPWGVVENLLNYSNNICKIKRIIARYYRGLNSELRKTTPMKIDNPAAHSIVGGVEPSRTELQRAERMLLLHGMPDTKDALDTGKLASLLPVWEGRIIVTRGRLGEKSLERLLGVSSLPILMAKSRVAYLYMVEAHCGEFGLIHRSAVATLARSRRKVWIVKGRNLARKVANSCPRCDRDRKKLLVQQMSDIKEESLTVAPPWRHVALDFAGPTIVKGQVNKRSKLKVWILLYTCRATRAVCLLATPGYSTSDFLCKHEEFVFRMGRPDSIVSDRGSQLVAAGIVLANKDSPSNLLDWKKVTSVNCATDWKFVPIGGQHRNGLSEATVKVLKKSLALALHPSVELVYAELVTLLARISYSINSRPLTIKNISPNSQQEDLLMPLTPNHLLLGRATVEVPDFEYDESNRFSARLSYVQQVFKCWWEKWIQDVLPTLVPCKRWKDIKKNLKVGDVVMMKYEGNINNDYRLARVKETFPDHKGLVRTVKVSYRRRDKREPADKYWKKLPVEEIVSIQRLALLQVASEPLASGGVEDQLPADAHDRLALVKAALCKGSYVQQV